VTSWNPAAEKLKGYLADEIIGRHFSCFYTDQAVAVNKPAQLLAEALQSGGLTTDDWRVRKDGSRFWAEVTLAPIITAEGQHLGFSKVTRDLSERKQHEEALQRYNQRLTALHQIDRDIISAHSIEEITTAALKHLRQVTDSMRSAVTLIDQVNETAVIFALDSEGDSSLQRQHRIPLMRNHSLEILESGQPLLIPDLQRLEGEQTEFAQRAIQEGIRASLSIPMIVRDELIGHLSVASKVPNFFTDEHIELTQEIANQLAIAFQSAQLLEDVQTTNRNLQMLSARLV
jgi:PAS domain S-box-containing protein